MMSNCEYVKQLTKENEEKYGEICPKCSLCASWCRCDNGTEKAKNCMEHDFKVFQSGYGQCKKCRKIEKL